MTYAFLLMLALFSGQEPFCYSSTNGRTCVDSEKEWSVRPLPQDLMPLDWTCTLMNCPTSATVSATHSDEWRKQETEAMKFYSRAMQEPYRRVYDCILMHEPTVGDYRCFNGNRMFKLRADHIQVTIIKDQP